MCVYEHQLYANNGQSCGFASIYLIILVGAIPSQQVLLYKQFLNNSVVNRWNGLLETFVKGLFCVGHSGWVPCYTTPETVQQNLPQCC